MSRSRAILFAALFFAGGMSGGNCTISMPNPGGGNPGGGGTTGGPQLLPEDHVLGDASASVIVFEYGDMQCPFCGFFARNDFPGIRQTYIDTGKIRFVFRHFPLAQHDRADDAARASECAADQGMFFEFHDLVFLDLKDNIAPTDARLRELADSLGLDLAQFDACFPPGDAKRPRVQQDVASGQALGVSATPTFFVNGVLTDRTNLTKEIDRQLNALGG